MDIEALILALTASALLALVALRLARRSPGRAGSSEAAAMATERQRARLLNVPNSARDRFLSAYRARGMSELQAPRKMNDDLERDRGRWR